MTPERWQKIEAVFQTAADLPTADRRSYLDQACASDHDLRAEVESLLDSEGLSHVAPAIEEVAQSVSSLSTLEGQRLGAYELLTPIGEGGMGTVYKAKRVDGQFEQEVAIKIIRAGASNPLNARRFLEERNLLAQLQHPSIARLIDGGDHAGIPYIVMELIEGLPIDAYCRQWNLTVKERLEIFIQVCDAVQHAHAALIVHRDLKPSNILVTTDGTPKLLDFGIAKLVVDGQTSTQTGWMMTPDYASPEQVRGEPITVASDVYSLGIVLYELLTGERPYKLKNYSPAEIQHLVCTTEIHPPSQHVPTETRLRKQLVGDLDNILLMALRKEAGRRYGSVAQFAEDIRRHLAGETVIARPDTFTYRWSKFARRNRLPLALATLLVAAVSIGAALTVREGIRAQRRFDEVRSLANSLLNEIDPEAAKLVGSARMRKLLMEKSVTYLDRLASESGDDVPLRKELARAYHRVGDIQGHVRAESLGLFNESLESHLKGIAIEEHLLSSFPNDAELKRSLALGFAHAGDLHARRGDAKTAESLIHRAYLLSDKTDLNTYVDVRVSMNQAWMLQGRLQDSFRVGNEAIEAARQLSDSTRLMTLYAYNSDVAHYLGETAQAVSLIRLGIDLGVERRKRSELSGVEELRMATLNYKLGQLLGMHDRPNEMKPCDSIPYLQSASNHFEQRFRQTNGSVNSLVLFTSALYSLSGAQALCGLKEAIATAEKAKAVYGADRATSNSNLDVGLGFAHLHVGNLDQASRYLRSAAARSVIATEYLAEIEAKRGNMVEARHLLAQAREDRNPMLKQASYDKRIDMYSQAANMTKALLLGDPTPGLKQEALALLNVFPLKGAAASVDKLRTQLQSLK